MIVMERYEIEGYYLKYNAKNMQDREWRTWVHAADWENAQAALRSGQRLVERGGTLTKVRLVKIIEHREVVE